MYQNKTKLIFSLAFKLDAVLFVSWDKTFYNIIGTSSARVYESWLLCRGVTFYNLKRCLSLLNLSRCCPST